VCLCAIFASVGAGSTAAVYGDSTPASASAQPVCNRAAAPRGNDRAQGTVGRPFATVARLVAALRPGQTGCLLQGEFDGDVVISKSGTRATPITLRAFPRGAATINGVVDWEPGGRYWRVTGIRINGPGTTKATVQIHDDGIRLDHDDITNHALGGSCILVGNLQYGVSRGTVIDHNRIHDCGAPGSAPYHHGVYVCCGYGTRVTNNFIWHSTGRGIQLYPDADGAVVSHNVIDDNTHKGGVTFGGDTYGACYQTSNATVSNNIITYNGTYGIDAFWGCSPGTGNRASRNCLWGNASGSITPDVVGFKASGNLRANPRFVARQNHDYRVRRGSPCARMGPLGRVGP
jgi:Right handed beta helix region